MLVSRTTRCCVHLLLVGGACALALDSRIEARQTPAEKQRRDAILRSWRDQTQPVPPLLPGEVAWTRTLESSPVAAGAMDDLHVYVPLHSGSVVALNRESGSHEWTVSIQVSVSPVVGGGLVYIAASDVVYAIEASTGEERWSTAVGSSVSVPLIFRNGWLLVATESGDVLGLRAADGAVIWRQPLGVRSSYAPAFGVDGAVYTSLTDGRVVALGGADGQKRWEQRLPGILSRPATADDRVFVGSTDNFLYAFDGGGKFEWKWRNGGDVVGAATDGDVVYIASLDNVIRAVNRGNGNQRWKRTLDTRPAFPPLAFGGVVVLPGVRPAVTSLVGMSGATQGTFAARGELAGPPLVDESPQPFRVALVTVTREGVIEALRPTGLLFRESALVPLQSLPGQGLTRERIP